MSDNLITVTIDGRQISVPKGTLVVEAARQLGIEIPVYCYHPKMKPVGACRVCAVYVENQRRPIMTACTTEVMPDMVVHTRDENAVAAREGILEFLLINHPLDCPVCDRGGECDLQDFTMRYGPPTTRFIEEKRHFEKSKQVGANVVLDRERCIMCQRCVRFCDEIAMEEGLVIIERGNRSEIGAFEGRSYDSQFSGNTIELCPVGALTSKTYRFQARPWEQQHFAGVCTHCSVGCNLTVDVRFDEVVRFRSRVNDTIDDGWLCDQGRYGYQHIHSEDRLEHPSLRNSAGELEKTTWDKALALLVEKLKASGSETSILLGTQLSLEDGHAFLRLSRGALNSPNLSHEEAHRAMISSEELVTATGQIMGCDSADGIICLGSNPTETHPVLDLRIKKGLRRRAKLAVLGQTKAMPKQADFTLEGQPTELWEKLIKELGKKKKSKEKGLLMPAPRPWEAGGSSSTDWKEFTEAAREWERVLVIVGDEVPTEALAAMTQQAKDLGWNQAPHGVLLLRRGANSLGLDMIGCAPNFGPGCEALKKNPAYQQAWSNFSHREGQAWEKQLTTGGKVALAVGCDPLANNSAKKADFLVALSTHPNETTKKADLVLPLASWLESHGTFVSTDGTVQFSRQAVLPVGESQPAWAVATKVIELLEGTEGLYRSPKAVFAEIGQLNPSLLGRSYRDFQLAGEAHWSYPQQAGLGMPRPDLSAIPVNRPDTPMWMPTENINSSVEHSGRLFRGETPPEPPGQRDPREVAALLGLADGYQDWPGPKPALPEVGESTRPGFVPLRVLSATSAQPPGPTPARRHHQLGLGVHTKIAVPALPAANSTSEELEEAEESGLATQGGEQ